MAYAAWSVVFGEQPSAAKWNILGSNDASFNDGTGLNAGAIQQIVYNETGAVATGTTLVPSDDTIPTSTEGDQYMTQAITPKATTNILEIVVTANIGSNTTGSRLMGMLYQDAGAAAIATSEVLIATGTGIVVSVTKHYMLAGTTSSTTFKWRAGGTIAGTVTFNGFSGARKMGGTYASTFVIKEYKV